MSPDEPADANAGAPAAGEPPAEHAADGVFGNLPRTRPGARSPRRDAGAAKPPPKKATTAAAPASEPGPPPGEPEAPPAGESGGGIEDVAWAGVAAAAEAATIGVRLATRALEAMRDAVDRR